MKYKIDPKIHKIAKKIGVLVYPSENKKYKLEIYDAKTGEFMFYGGAMGYWDYFTYRKKLNKDYAKERRRLYLIRHNKEVEAPGSRGWYVAKLLWDA